LVSVQELGREDSSHFGIAALSSYRVPRFGKGGFERLR